MCRTTETANRRCFVRYNKPHQTPKTPYTKHQMAVTALTPSTILSTFLSPFSYHRFEEYCVSLLAFFQCVAQQKQQIAAVSYVITNHTKHQKHHTPNTKWQLLPSHHRPSFRHSFLLFHITDLSTPLTHIHIKIFSFCRTSPKT